MKPLADIGDPAAPTGSPEWCKYIHGLMCQTKRRANSEVSSLKYTLTEFKKSEHWKRLTDAAGQPFMAWEDYVQYPEPDGLGMAAADAEAIITEQNDKRLIADIRAAEARADDNEQRANKRGRGRPKKNSRDKNNIPAIKTASRQGDLRRLEKDRPDIHARVLAGEITPNAGMIEAGFRKKRPSKRLDAAQQIDRLLKKLGPGAQEDYCTRYCPKRSK